MPTQIADYDELREHQTSPRFLLACSDVLACQDLRGARKDAMQSTPGTLEYVVRRKLRARSPASPASI
jgi:hypothetical protein